MAKSDRSLQGYCGGAFHMEGESEGSGSSGQIDTEITASGHSSAPTRKFIDLNANRRDSFGVPMQVLSPSHMSSSERKDLVRKLRYELNQIRMVQKRVELQNVRAAAGPSGREILSCSNGINGSRTSNFKKASARSSTSGKIMNPSGKGQWSRGVTGKFESGKQASVPSTANVMLMKQCETLLKRVMTHQFAWVFNNPVDVVKLNIPDYLIIIRHPMDLGTIKTKIVSGVYSSPLEFLEDVRLTFRNAMEYNPKGHDVHNMADTLSKFFEVRWKAIEKKLPKNEAQTLPAESGPHEEMETTGMSPAKRRKITSFQHEIVAEPVKQVMTIEEKHSLGRELESLMGEMPIHIINFLRDHCSNGRDPGVNEIEIDIDDLSDETMFALRKLLDEYINEKHKNQANVGPCEIELLNESGPSNSSIQLLKGNEPGDEEVDIGGNEPPVTSYPSLEVEKNVNHDANKCVSSELDKGACSGNESDGHVSSPVNSSKVPDTANFVDQLDNETRAGDLLEGKQSSANLDRHKQISQQNLSCLDLDHHQDGDNAQCQKQLSSDKQYRAALLKNRFADIILKAREKTLLQNQGHDDDPERLQREREELELRKKKEKARLQAEAKAAEEARKRAEEVAAEEARQKRELEREAARQALLEMEKTVVIDENSQLLKELEMLRSAPAEHLPLLVDEASPVEIQDGLGGFNLGGTNPLERLGLFMKEDEDEEECDPLNVLKLDDDMEEGEID